MGDTIKSNLVLKPIKRNIKNNVGKLIWPVGGELNAKFRDLDLIL